MANWKPIHQWQRQHDMPRMVECPVCGKRLKLPVGAGRGFLAQCPECEEQFVPEGLEESKEYDPEEAESFAMAGREGRTQENSKRKAIRRGIKRKENQRYNDEGPRKTIWEHFFDGKDSYLLVLAFIFGLFAPTLYLIVSYANKKSPNAVMIGGIIVCYIMAMLVFARKIWKGQSRAGGLF